MNKRDKPSGNEALLAGVLPAGTARTAPDEYDLIRQCLAGERDKFSILVERYKSMAYSVAYRMTGDQDAANDMAQESFLSAYTGLKHFQYSSKFSTWLYQIVMNKCRDYLRAGKNKVSVDEIAELRADPRETPEESASSRQMSGAVRKALGGLPPEYREVIVLKHMEGLDYHEMSQILGASVGALKVRAHRGRELLKDLLEKAGIDHA
jgi:RNA polymerase sigma-70 factor (ECF subfamily)